MTTIYHNPSCSKSRASLELLKGHETDFQIVHYLETPLSRGELQNLLQKLNLPARAILRTGEAIFQERYADLDLNDEAAILDAISQYPVLLERPIVVKGDKAVLGRPPENLASLWS